MARIRTKEQSDGANPLSDAAEAEDAKARAETTAGQSGDTEGLSDVAGQDSESVRE